MPEETQIAPEPTRVPQARADEALGELIRETLARPDIAYNINACAKFMGLNYGRIESFVRRHPEIAAMCPEKDTEKLVPSDMSILDRKPTADATGILLPKEQAALMKKLVRDNDRVIARGWRDIGLSDADAKAMEEAERRAALPIGRVLAASEGHLLGMLARSARMLDRTADQLVNGEKSEFGPLPVITDMAGSNKTEIEYMKVYHNGIKTHIEIQNTLLRTRAATIDAMKKLKDLKVDQKKEEKGVFEVTDAKTDHK